MISINDFVLTEVVKLNKLLNFFVILVGSDNDTVRISELCYKRNIWKELRTANYSISTLKLFICDRWNHSVDHIVSSNGNCWFFNQYNRICHFLWVFIIIFDNCDGCSLNMTDINSFSCIFTNLFGWSGFR